MMMVYDENINCIALYLIPMLLSLSLSAPTIDYWATLILIYER